MDWLAIAQLGGFAFAAAVMAYAARRMFEAWTKGELVGREIWQKSEARSDTLTTQLERNTDALVRQTGTMARLAAAQERQARALEALVKELRELRRRDGA